MPKEKDEFPSWLLPMFDSSVYPNIEKVPKRFAILKRNEWLINNSDFLIAYVHRLGGAHKTLEYAQKKKHIKVINIA